MTWVDASRHRRKGTAPRSAQATTFAGVVAGLALAGAVMAVATAPAAPSASRVPVFFLQGEQLLGVMRPGSTPADALRGLLAGPTRAEVKRGLRTYVPRSTKVRRVTVRGGLATVDLSGRFVSGRDQQSLVARLSQLVRTLTGLQGTVRVKLLIDSKTVRGVFPGISHPVAAHVPLPADAQRRRAEATPGQASAA